MPKIKNKKNTAKTPQKLYELMLEKGQLKADVLQAEIVEHFEELHEALKSYDPLELKGGGFLHKIFGKTPSKNIPSGLYIYGGVGRGKSMLMDLFFDCAPTAQKRRVHFHSFMLEIHGFLHQWRYMNSADRKGLLGTDQDDPIPPLAAKVAQESLLLCFDEFQVTDVTDAMLLGRLFEELFSRGVIMVLTSNRIPDDLYKDGLNRGIFLPTIELIKNRLQIIALDGPVDYRMQRMQGVRTYHYPLGSDATILLSKAFWQLTDHDVDDRSEVGSEVIDVQGRQLEIPVASRGVALV
jgi:cell division protein ZapE